MAQAGLSSIKLFINPFFSRNCFQLASLQLIRQTAARTYSCASLIKPCERVLVAGGTGIVGSGIVQAVLKQGAKVIVVTRCMEHYKTLTDATPESLRPNLFVVMGDLTTEDGMQSVFEQITGDGLGLHHVVATLRGNKSWWQCGRMWDQSLCELYQGSRAEVLPHFLLMRAFLPFLDNVIGSTYTVITGYPESECAATGKPSSLVGLAAGTLQGLADAARAEHTNSNVAVSEIHLNCTVHKMLDCEVCCMGTQHLGHDLVGSVVIGVAGCGSRREVVINCREEAVEWAKMDAAAGSYPCPSSCSNPRPPCPLPPCPPPCDPFR